MNKTYATSQFCEISLSQLGLDDFNAFLRSGFVIQRPLENKLWIGVDLYEHPHGIFIAHSFFNDFDRKFSPRLLIHANIVEFHEFCMKYLSGKFEIVEEENSDHEFKEDLERIDNWFKQDAQLKKIVAVTTSTYKIKGEEHPLVHLNTMLGLQGSLYGLWQNSKGVIGVSPEPLFVKLKPINDKSLWMTRSLAGTISTKIENYQNKLIHDPKENNEHELVIKDILEKLAPFVSEVVTGETQVVPFGKIAHLQTDISFTAYHLSASKLVQILGPTAALGGFPRDLSQKYLRKLNYYNRDKEERSFGGTIAFDYQDESFGLVGIRNFYWDLISKKGVIHSGGGIVRESIYNNELAEVLNKRDTIRSLFNE